MLLPAQEQGGVGARVRTSVRIRVSDVYCVGTEDSAPDLENYQISQGTILGSPLGREYPKSGPVQDTGHRSKAGRERGFSRKTWVGIGGTAATCPARVCLNLNALLSFHPRPV